jgi:hypothetical protein
MAFTTMFGINVREQNRLNGTIQQCGNCNERGTGQNQLPQCSKCKTVRYCDAECQKKHWSKHRAECYNAEIQRKNNKRMVKTEGKSKEVVCPCLKTPRPERAVLVENYGCCYPKCIHPELVQQPTAIGIYVTRCTYKEGESQRLSRHFICLQFCTPVCEAQWVLDVRPYCGAVLNQPSDIYNNGPRTGNPPFKGWVDSNDFAQQEAEDYFKASGMAYGY